MDMVERRLNTIEAAVLGLTKAVSNNSERLDAVERRLDGVERRLNGVEAAVLGLTEAVSQNSERLDRVEHRLDTIEAVVLENRTILLSIADHLDLTLEKPPQESSIRLSCPFQVQRQQTPQNLFFIIEYGIFPAIGIADRFIQRPVQLVQARGEVGGGGFGFNAVVSAKDLQRVVEVGQMCGL